MATVNTLVITGYGTNSHLETAHTARLAGSDRADVVHFSDLVAGNVCLAGYHFLIFPGGFLDGDDLGAAQTAAMRWRYLKDAQGTPLLQSLREFLDQRGIAKCHLLGFSDGGNIALLFALKYPQYVEKLVLNGANLRPSGVKLSTRFPLWRGGAPAGCAACSAGKRRPTGRCSISW